MKYCPNCKMDFEDYAEYCNDCGARLEEKAEELTQEPEQDIGDVIPVYLTNMEPVEAAMLAELLRSHNIPVLAKAPRTGDVQFVIMGDSICGRDLFVNERDWEIASKLLKEYQGGKVQDMPDCRDDGVLKRRRIARVVLWIVLGLMALGLLKNILGGIVAAIISF